MKIIRWLLSHTVLILLIVVVIYGYMFWGNLLGEDTPAGKGIAYLSEEFEEVAEFVDAVKAKQENRQQQATASSSEAQVQTQADDTKPAIPVAAEHETEVAETGALAVDAEKESTQPAARSGSVEQQPVSISYSHNDMRVEQDSRGAIKAVPETRVTQTSQQKNVPQHDQAAISSVVAATSVDNVASPSVNNAEGEEVAASFVPVEVKEQLDNLDDQGKVIDASKNETLRESWITARKSFYQRNYEKSEQSYLKVIDASENNYDAYGELGNVYFNQGKNEQAASAYYEAAVILVRQGQKGRARSLMGLLRHLDKSKAIELKKLLESPA